MRYNILLVFFVAWGVAAVITGVVDSNAAADDSSFQDFGNTVFDSQAVKVDRPPDSSQNPVSAAYEFAKTTGGYVAFMWNSAALNSEIWEGWAQPIRWVLLILAMPMLLLFGLEGAKVLSGFIPFT